MVWVLCLLWSLLMYLFFCIQLVGEKKMQLLTNIPVFKQCFICLFFLFPDRCEWPALWTYLWETEPPGGSEAKPLNHCNSAESQHSQPKPPSPPPEPRHNAVQPAANGAKSSRRTYGHSGQPARQPAQPRGSALRPHDESSRTDGGSGCPCTNRPSHLGCFGCSCCSRNPSHSRRPSCSAYHHGRGAGRSAASALPPWQQVQCITLSWGVRGQSHSLHICLSKNSE